MVSASELAKYIIRSANLKQELITNLKLQKILYYVAGVYAGVHGSRLFGEDIEAWQYGPVVRSVYIEYCPRGSLPLVMGNDVTLDCGSVDLTLIDFVIDQKVRMTGRQLVNATHSESPWKKYSERVDEKPIIQFEEIAEYFRSSEEVKVWNERQQSNEIKNC